MANLRKLREFVQSVSELIDQAAGDEVRVVAECEELLRRLVDQDDWLPEPSARPDAASYRQNLLYCDPRERFSVVSFVWGPRQATPVHDHTVWGLIGVLRGAELCQEFELPGDASGLRPAGKHLLRPGEIDRVSPRSGDIHRVANALVDRPSVSIHLYGANIGAVQRQLYDSATGAQRRFVSGYSNSVLPNIWDRQRDPAD